VTTGTTGTAAPIPNVQLQPLPTRSGAGALGVFATAQLPANTQIGGMQVLHRKRDNGQITQQIFDQKISEFLASVQFPPT